jgi:hypothetical protein
MEQMQGARLSILCKGRLELLASRRVTAVFLNGSRVLELLQPLQQRGRDKPFVVAKAHPLPHLSQFEDACVPLPPL